MDKSWEGKKIVVTGGTGMVGRFLCQMLVSEGAHVVSLSRYPHNKEHIDGVQYVAGDAGNVNICQRVMQGAHVVFNLAASVGGVYFNSSNQFMQLWDNLRLQMAPAIAARQCEVPYFLQTSSVCVYAPQYNNPAIEENGHLGEPRPANAGYAYAKRFGETATHLIFQDSETKYVIVRLTNMYGEGDNFGKGSHVIPALIRQFVESDDPITVYNGNCSREFMHAEDGARGMIQAIQDGGCEEVYNLGTDGETQVTIGALAVLIKTLAGSNAHIEFIDDGIAGDQDRRTDCSKARHHFAWFHYVDLTNGLVRTIEHYCNQVSCQKT
jgi:nucleoside-diphosphate-sugar epimerase